MCAGVRYVDSNGRDWKIYFPSPSAALPIMRGDGVEWVKWGRRSVAEEGQGFVVTGWARWVSVLDGRWDWFQPELVTLAARQFMEKGSNPFNDPNYPKRKPAKKSFWFDVGEGNAIQALIAHVKDQQRVYVVTSDIPREYIWLDRNRWPKIIKI